MSHETENRAGLWGALVGGGLLVAVAVTGWAGLPAPEDPEALAWSRPVIHATSGSRVLVSNPREAEGTWKMVPMTGGPAVYTACVAGDRLFAMNKTAWRGSYGLWPDVALAVSKGACRARVPGR